MTNSAVSHFVPMHGDSPDRVVAGNSAVLKSKKEKKKEKSLHVLNEAGGFFAYG